VFDFLLDRYRIYLMSSDPNAVADTDTPLTEYIVKETYYPAPAYNQYDLETRTQYPNRTNTIRPVAVTRAQKVCVPAFASGRYVGVSFGSRLDGVTRATRGLASQRPRMYAVRVGTQLFDFLSSGGRVVEAGVTQQARFLKTFTGGIMTGCSVQTPGQRYAKASYTTPDVVPYSGQSFTYYDDGDFVDRTETLLVEQGDALRQSLAAQNLAVTTQSRESFITATMADDTVYDQYLYRTRAASKTPLRRSAMFQLAMRVVT
jgi:hypothetical protein